MRKLGVGLAGAAVLIAGCGGGGTDRKVTLSISGSGRNVNMTACGKQEPFQIYAKAPARVPYAGTVTPAPDGRWKVKVKLKRCETNGNFQDVSGEIPVPENGAYSIRARFQSDNRPQSDKLYLKVGS